MIKPWRQLLAHVSGVCWHHHHTNYCPPIAFRYYIRRRAKPLLSSVPSFLSFPKSQSLLVPTSTMTTFKHMWVGASVLATLVACVLAQTGGEGGGFVLPYALTLPPRSVYFPFSVQFYNQSLVTTVQPVGPNRFGEIDVLEAPVTITSEPNSTVVADARGVVFFVSQQFPGIELKVTLTFRNNSGLPANSSINFEGFRPYPAFFPGPYNVSAVGGTGAFACAQGVLTLFITFANQTLTTLGSIAYLVVGCNFNATNAFYLFSSGSSS